MKNIDKEIEATNKIILIWLIVVFTVIALLSAIFIHFKGIS